MLKNKKTNVDKNYIDGWLDRKGKLHPCKFNKHNNAEEKLMKKYNLKYTPEYLGWFKVHSAGVYFFEACHFHNRQYVKPTKLQMKWLFKNGYDMHLLERYYDE